MKTAISIPSENKTSPVKPVATSLLTFEETAEMLRKTPSQLRWMVHADTAPTSAKIGGRRMFRLSDVEAYIQNAFSGNSAA